MGKEKFDEITHFNSMKVIKNEKIEIEDEPKQIELTLMDKMILNLK